MNILGIHMGHNSTVSYMKNNKLVSTISEEKFANIKNCGGFPKRAMDYTFANFIENPDDIDMVVIAGLYFGKNSVVPRDDSQEIADAREPFIKDIIYRLLNIGDHRIPNFYKVHLKIVEHMHKSKIKNQEVIKNHLNAAYKIRPSTVKFMHHHLAHAYAPIGFYNLHNAGKILVFTQDGSGDTLSGSIGIYENGKYTLVDTTPFINSMGDIYSSVARYLGMKINEHEYKVMGMAPYPSPKHAMNLYDNKFKELVDVKDGKIIMKYKTQIPYIYSEYVLKERLYFERFDNIAFAVQKLLEEKICQYIKENMEKYKIYKIATGGGLFMNVKVNKRIQELPNVEKCYFMPSSCDESLSTGAVFYGLESSGQFGKSDETIYLGKEYSDEEIEQYISSNNLDKEFEITSSKNPEKEVAEMLSCGKIVGRFVGRGEWGARSLGNRAILADPSKLESIEIINNAIKSRDFWMPFACSVLDSKFDEYAESDGKSYPNYMITSFDSTVEGKKCMKAGLHRKDYTMRPNVVTSEHNPDYHNLLKCFNEKTGLGGVLNTSLNISSYPLIGFLPELFFTMKNSDLNISQCGNFIIRKRCTK